MLERLFSSQKKRQERHWKNQVKEIIMGQTKNDFDGFKEAMQPAVDWLQKNGNPHQRIIIELDGVELLIGEMAFSVKIPD